MNRRERLMATVQGGPVDRPAVSFYEINGLDERPGNPDPFNIYSHPSWQPLLDLAREKTDRIVMRGVPFDNAPPDPLDSLTQSRTTVEAGCRRTVQTVTIGHRTLTARTRRDIDVNTVWTEEHLLKDVDDLAAYLSAPAQQFGGTPHVAHVLDAETALGDTGIVMIDTADPLCLAAQLFSMAEYTVIAMTEPRLFRQLLDRFASFLLSRTEAVAKALPGRLWRIYGPEYASPPYLPPRLFREYVCAYVTPMINSIKRYGGYARVHCHGRLHDILDDIAAMGADGLDPVEPPPQGDVELRYVRERYGRQMVLFGNLEVSDIETLPTNLFAEKVRRALDEGTRGAGRGFVLMPSACPYGREVQPLTLRNYETIIGCVERVWSG
ncbi:hypothetical protein GX586_02670 [bacterium]|nr:hypothetical protein [bacterium]